MRTSYEVVDDLDVIAMDQFQRRFFERRQGEWQTFLDDNANAVRQIDGLADPRYFDFLSFAQYLVSAAQRPPVSSKVRVFLS